MDFFGMGIGELLLILVVALLLWGPRRMVEISRAIGRTIYNLRKYSTDFTARVTRELEGKDKVPPAK